MKSPTTRDFLGGFSNTSHLPKCSNLKLNNATHTPSTGKITTIRETVGSYSRESSVTVYGIGIMYVNHVQIPVSPSENERHQQVRRVGRVFFVLSAVLFAHAGVLWKDDFIDNVICHKRRHETP